MPLLRKKHFITVQPPLGLQDNDHVFFSSLTGEIFTQYDEYCERVILVNSMVWSCEFTGKANLTYSEALDSEKRVRRLLRDFPLELRVPIIYLASITKRCLFSEMVEDVFVFVRDKYFIGETVEICTGKDNWCEAHVLAVTKAEPGHVNGKNSSPNKCCMLYNYEVEQFEDDGNGKILVVPGDKIRRPRSLYTREKNKLFLKQFIEQNIQGLIKIKDSTLEKYNISKVKFDQIFIGSPPVFPSSKKFEKLLSNVNNVKKFTPDKKPRQESISKYMTKTSNKFEGEIRKSDGKSLMLDMQRVRDDKKQKKVEEKKRKKEKMARFAAYIKQWNKQKDDLELVDHKHLPAPIPVQLPGIPNKYFGNIMALMEFINDFSKTIKVKDFFPSGIDLELLIRAMTVQEVAGPLTDLIQMLLNAVFMLQEGEAEEYNGMKIPNINPADLSDDEDTPMTSSRAVLLATSAAQWPQTYLSSTLTSLPMDSQTFTEILRLHLLSSGSTANERCLKWRYQQRGGYNCSDDPGILLRLQKPNIIKDLATKHVTQLPMSNKFDLINCLMNQILSYASVRDQVEEKIENLRELKNKIRALQIEERRRDLQFSVDRAKIRKNANSIKLQGNLKGEKADAVDADTKDKLEKLISETESKKALNEKKAQQLESQYFILQSFLGTDRAYRKYWLYETVPGLFIEHNNKVNGVCLSKPIIPEPTLASAQPEDTLHYIQRLFESEKEGSDKENDNDESSNKRHTLSPKKPLTENSHTLIKNLLMCTTNEESCPVHSRNIPQPQWSVFYTPEHIDALVDSLNKRGIREGELKQTMESKKEVIINYVTRCPISMLNPSAVPPANKPDPNVLTRLAKKYVDANLRFPAGTDINEVLEMTLRDAIVDMEEKVHLGCLGELQVEDRVAWSKKILNREYDKQCLKLSWGPSRSIIEDLQIINGNTKPDEYSTTYKDPGYYLGEESNIVDSDTEAEEKDVKKEAPADVLIVRSLASALLQLGQAIHPKFLKKLPGSDSKDPKAVSDLISLKKWEVSLMECTSFAQVTLHLAILDNSISWSKSVLNANCRICRRKNDPENMLLCDSCNKGHHLYCLKPKLAKVPEGDWFCLQCKPKEKTPQKKKNRKVFNDNSDTDNENDDDDDSGNEEVEEEEGDDEEDDKSWQDSEVCQICSSGGELVNCTVCSQGYHPECLGKTPRSKSFVCNSCVRKPNKKPRRDSNTSEEVEDRAPPRKISKSKEKSKTNNKRKSAPTLNGNNEDSEASESPLSLLKSTRKRSSNNMANGHVNGHSESSRPKRSSAPITNGMTNGHTRKSRRSEVLFHKSQIEELINETLRHNQCGDFSTPVDTKNEVPDYFDFVTEPMDFGTIKSKLKDGKYTSDEQVMNDSLLVFNNCVAYNHDESPVAKAGVKLRKFFEKKCKDLGLVCFSEEESSQPDSKKFKHF